MTENNQSFTESNIQSDGIKKPSSVLNPISLIGKLLSIRDSSQSTNYFIKAFLDYLVSQPAVIQASYYSLDQKSRDITLNYLSTKSLEEKELSGITFSSRSTETVARVALNAQPFLISDLGSEIVSYQKAILDSKTRSIFISPILKSNQVVSLVDIQSEKAGGFDQDDLLGLNLSIQLFGRFIDDTLLVEISGMSFPQLVNYADVTRKIIGADDPQLLNKVLLSAFYNSDLVAFIFGVEESYLTLEDLYDSKGTGFDTSLIGLKVEVGNLNEKFSSGETQFFTDLPANSELGDLFSFFIRRECLSLAVLPILQENFSKQILIIGSRETEPLIQKDIFVFQSIVETYQKRIAFDSRAMQTKYLERDFEFLRKASGLISQNLDQQAYFTSILEIGHASYGEYFSLSFLNLQSEKSIIEISKFSTGNDPAGYTHSVTPEEINTLEQINKPFVFQEVEDSIKGIFSSVEPKADSILIPAISGGQSHGYLIFTPIGSDCIFQEISPLMYESLGRLISSYFVQRKLQQALLRLDETVSKTVNRQQLLNQISISVSSGRSQNEILSSIPSRLVDFSICDQACILIPDPTGILEIRHSHGFSEKQIGQTIISGQRIAGKAASSNQAAIYLTESSEGKNELVNPLNRSGIAAPISFGDEIFAILEIEHSKPDQYTDYDLELLQIFSLNVGSLLANIRLIDQVRAQVNRQEKLFEVTNKLRRSLDMGSILQISTDEIAKLTNASKASIQIKVAEDQIPGLDSETGGGDE
jgi:putative methionine-R-sulfoxide reductase with GAF domain